MSLWLALLAQAAPTVAADLDTLPELPWATPPAVTTEAAAYVAAEARAGKCAVTREGHSAMLTVQMAIELRSGVGPARIIPRAINCPNVEQYAAGLISRAARTHLKTSLSGWYRTSVTFIWIE